MTPADDVQMRAAAHLTVRVRLLTMPCLWCWEIVDERQGTEVWSSWAHEWTAYASRDEALGAGQARLRDLTTSSRPLLSSRPVSRIA